MYGEEDPLVEVGHLLGDGQRGDVVDVAPLLALLQRRKLNGKKRKGVQI